MGHEEIINKFINSLKIKTRLDAKIEDSKIKIIRTTNTGQIIELNGEEYVDEMKQIEEVIFYVEVEEILALEKKNQEYTSFDDKDFGLGIFNNSYFETAVEMTRSGSTVIRRRLEDTQVQDCGYIFEVTKLSPEYLYFLLTNEKYIEEDLDRILFYRTYYDDDDFTNTFSDFTNIIRINSCKIIKDESNNNVISKIKYQSMAESYLFNISYSLSIMLDFHKFKRIKNYRTRTKRETQYFPYRNYESNLIKYYYQAISSEIPFVQYIAFYHIIEHFFFSVSEEEVYKEIKDLITKPSFVPKNKENIMELYNNFKKITKSQTEDGLWRENEALLRCLNKLVPDLNSLKKNLHKLDSEYINHYKNNVFFIEEEISIDFNIEDQELIYKKIRNRVYAVRNAIVHSKEGNNSKYQPFIHDLHLSNEVPLIRAIAEEVIINTAEEMKY